MISVRVLFYLSNFRSLPHRDPEKDRDGGGERKGGREGERGG